jgi:valyl-tRNA synthetase
MLTKLTALVNNCTTNLDEYDYTAALRETEAFFWWFCDDHIEHVKRRRAGEGPEAESATASCLVALSAMLRLFAPFLPFVTEEIWSWWKDGSVHRAEWPTEAEVLAGIGVPDASGLRSVVSASEVTALIRRERSLRKIAFGVPVQTLQLPASVQRDWDAIAGDVLAGNNATQATTTFGDDFAIEFAPASPQAAS